MLLRRMEGMTRNGVRYAAATSLLCMLVMMTFLATQTEVTAQTIIEENTTTTIPVGEYAALLERPSPPPGMSYVKDGVLYTPVYYNYSWYFDGTVDGGPISIRILNNSNYQAFNNSKQYSVYQQLSNVSGGFYLHVALPNNGPNGTCVFSDLNATYDWWIVFDNRAGSSNATLYIDYALSEIGVRYVPHPYSGEDTNSSTDSAIPVIPVAGGVVTVVLIFVCSVLLRKRRSAHAVATAY
jgi:hypothetical protein